MFTNDQLKEIDQRLQAGETPEKIAVDYGGLTHSQFRYALTMSGKKWRTYRRLEDIVPVDHADRSELAEATR